MEKCSTDRYHSSNMHLQNNRWWMMGDGARSILHSELLKSFTLFLLTRLSSLTWWLRTWNTQRPWLTNCQHCGGRESRIKLLHSEFWKWQPCCGRCYSAPQALCDLMWVRTCFWKIYVGNSWIRAGTSFSLWLNSTPTVICTAAVLTAEHLHSLSEHLQSMHEWKQK